ncbi:unnamed protein product [Timema podura]|uniref:Secreted protein n=1 Tax=Timema podura TaxID=61482 RepID=A0ABN7P6L7_TIMPD|nr:unnamed protein product [Timema podura]
MIRSLWNTSYSIIFHSLSHLLTLSGLARERCLPPGAAAWQQALALHEVSQQRAEEMEADSFKWCWVQWQDSTAATHYNCTRGINMKLSLHM